MAPEMVLGRFAFPGAEPFEEEEVFCPLELAASAFTIVLSRSQCCLSCLRKTFPQIVRGISEIKYTPPLSSLNCAIFPERCQA